MGSGTPTDPKHVIRRWHTWRAARERQRRIAAKREDPLVCAAALDRFGLQVTDTAQTRLHTEGWQLVGTAHLVPNADVQVAAVKVEKPDGTWHTIKWLTDGPDGYGRIYLTKDDSLDLNIILDLGTSDTDALLA